MLGMFAADLCPGSLAPSTTLPLVAPHVRLRRRAGDRPGVGGQREETDGYRQEISLRMPTPTRMPDLGTWTALVSGGAWLLILFPLLFQQVEWHFQLYKMTEEATFLDWLWFSIDKTYLKALPDWSILYGVHISSIDVDGPWSRHLILLSRLTIDYILIQGLFRLLAIRATIREAVAAVKVDPEMAVRLGKRAVAPRIETLHDPDRAVRGAAANALDAVGGKLSGDCRDDQGIATPPRWPARPLASRRRHSPRHRIRPRQAIVRAAVGPADRHPDIGGQQQAAASHHVAHASQPAARTSSSVQPAPDLRHALHVKKDRRLGAAGPPPAPIPAAARRPPGSSGLARHLPPLPSSEMPARRRPKPPRSKPAPQRPQQRPGGHGQENTPVFFEQECPASGDGPAVMSSPSPANEDPHPASLCCPPANPGSPRYIVAGISVSTGREPAEDEPTQ